MSLEDLRASFPELAAGSQIRTDNQTGSSGDPSSEGAVQVTCFTEDLHDVTLHFQITRFSKQCAVILALRYIAHSYPACQIV
ncbi:hypothetical protein EJB05_02515, partial [Eragrostis curvula]